MHFVDDWDLTHIYVYEGKGSIDGALVCCVASEYAPVGASSCLSCSTSITHKMILKYINMTHRYMLCDYQVIVEIIM